MHYGYFGGTFDPPHRAHLLVAQAAADAFALDRVFLAPTGRQPLKQSSPMADYADRLAMVKLLCAADPRLEASPVDPPHADGSPNYTIDTLETLARHNPEAGLFSIVGADSFLTLPQWRNAGRLLELAQWIVVSRPGFALEELFPFNLSEQQRSRVHLLTTVEDDTSATGIRDRLRAGVSIGDCLTPEIALYIARQRLYHPDR